MQPANAPRRAFTLVEMLVVITIIGILAAILVPVVGSAIATTKNATMAMELKELDAAIRAYASDHNSSLPPDFSNLTALEAHIQAAYPRNMQNIAQWFRNPGGQLSPDPRTLDGAEAIVFWLGGGELQTAAGIVTTGVFDNVRNPLMGPGKREINKYFEFEQERLRDIDGDGWPEFYPEHGPGAPYVYFDGRIVNATDPNTNRRVPTSVYAWSLYPSPYNATNPAPPLTGASGNNLVRDTTASDNISLRFVDPNQSPAVRPFRSSEFVVTANETKTWPNDAGVSGAVNNTQWMNEGEFQLIIAGLNNEFGFDNGQAGALIYKRFPNVNYYTSGLDRDPDLDNLANFSDGSTFEDSIP